MTIFSGLQAGTHTYKRLLLATRQYWTIFLLGVVGTIVLSLIDAGFAWLIKPIIDQGFIHRDQKFIQWLPALVVFIFLVRGIAGFVSNYFISRVSRNVVMDFRRQIFAKLLRLPANFYDQHSSGHLLSTVIYNVEQVATASSSVLLTVLREGSLALGLLIVMFVVSWQLALLFLITSPVIAWVVRWSSARLRRLSSSVQDSMGDVTQVAAEGIENFKVVRLFGGEKYEYGKFHAATRCNQQRELKIVITNSIGTSMVQLLISLPIALTLWFATMPSLHISAGSFGAVVTAMVNLLRPMRRVTMVNSEIQKGVAGAASIFQVLDEAVERDEGQVILSRARGELQYQQVNFRYSSSKTAVLQNVSFQVKPGQTIAIVGKSGGGKSTLVNLLPRFYEIESGHITLDGIDIREYRLEDLRQQFALVSQNTTLFNDTVANNIAYGLESKHREADIVAAAEAANAMPFIQQLPQGLQTLIGENGVLLSGGQRQRIAIARALLKRAPILILDEATASLDTYSERHIQEALDNLMQQCTTLVIAHRLSTIENANWILVVDNGEIVEQGTHEHLLQQNGVYAGLHRLQFKESDLYSSVLS